MLFHCLDARSPKLSCWCFPPDAVEQNPSHVSLPASGNCQHSLRFLGLYHITYLCPHITFSCVQSPSASVLPGYLPLFWAHLNNSERFLQILNLITSVKILFLNKVEFTSSRDWDMNFSFEGTNLGCICSSFSSLR